MVSGTSLAGFVASTWKGSEPSDKSVSNCPLGLVPGGVHGDEDGTANDCREGRAMGGGRDSWRRSFSPASTTMATTLGDFLQTATEVTTWQGEEASTQGGAPAMDGIDSDNRVAGECAVGWMRGGCRVGIKVGPGFVLRRD
ncbi:hypothetical protein PIB30_072469 [Stylosanthes scabra]|uniref:Uncharacterized protein n=1 Tax=Stylosanthes scabra TaxID=79078 RepID=A0ABU6QNV0_9FABA|nr:hypothetical protein [Stylosanthes scabra]